LAPRRVDILGVGFDRVDLAAAAERIIERHAAGQRTFVITANPEFVMLTRRDAELADLARASELVVADGTGVLVASRVLRDPLPGRVPGRLLVPAVLQLVSGPVFLLGAAPGVAERAGEAGRHDLLASRSVRATPPVAGAEAAHRDQHPAARAPVGAPGEVPPAIDGRRRREARDPVAPELLPSGLEPAGTGLGHVEDDGATDHAGLGMSVEGAPHLLEPVGRRDGVVVQEAHHLAARLRDAGVAREGESGEGALDQAQPIGARGEGRPPRLRHDLRGRAVGGIVVDDHHLVVGGGEALRAEARQGSGEVRGAAVGAHDDGEPAGGG